LIAIEKIEGFMFFAFIEKIPEKYLFTSVATYSKEINWAGKSERP
jgi:hypothetical protein